MRERSASSDAAASDQKAGRSSRFGVRSAFPLLALGVAASLGVLAGVGGYTFSYAKGLSYLSTDPAACANCHIMQGEYDAWQKASHHTSAVCVDCHLPKSFFAKYYAKAENGYRHGKLFTTGGFDEPITVKAAGLRILQENCIRCHAETTAEMTAHHAPAGEQLTSCLHCHRTVGHGQPAGLGGPMTQAEEEELKRLVTAAKSEAGEKK